MSAGSGTDAVAVSAPIVGLPAATRINFRVVATGPGGVTRGANRSFTTAKVPNGLSIGVAPGVVKFTGTTVIAGQLSGSGNAPARQ